MKKLLLISLTALLYLDISAQIKSQDFIYNDGPTALEGFLAYDKSLGAPAPIVIVVPEWNGINDLTRGKCEQLAAMGYVAFAADVYGKGVRPSNPEESAKISGQYKNNRPLLRQRMMAALQTAKTLQMADSSQVVVIGYCFGGTAALELGRTGADVEGIVSFHGGLSNPSPLDAKNIQSSVLILHGAIDPYVPNEEVQLFLKEMNDAEVDYQFIAYSGAVHSFTNPNAGDDPSKGAAYNELADQRSWKHFELFLQELENQSK